MSFRRNQTFIAHIISNHLQSADGTIGGEEIRCPVATCEYQLFTKFSTLRNHIVNVSNRHIISINGLLLLTAVGF